MNIQQMRNIAIIAHVDHGKTTLVDRLLQQSGTIKMGVQERIMDSNDIEKERGITIMAKNTAIHWRNSEGQQYRINIVDTPGHADFGGEVERILSMVDSVLLLVDAFDGPMPQTRFVTQKAFERKLKPIVVINKIDRPGARPHWVLDQVFELFSKLGATDEQLDFPVVYASALEGFAISETDQSSDNMDFLFESVVRHVPVPDVNLEGPLQMQISQLDYSNYVGLIGLGRISRGKLKAGQAVSVCKREGHTVPGKILEIYSYLGLERSSVSEAQAGDIVAIAGIKDISISDTICAPNNVEPLPQLKLDEPTVSVLFQVSNSPLLGQEGQYVTSRQLGERLAKERMYNVALKIESTEDSNRFRVCGRGELQLAVLIENMRREGYEFSISKPEVIFKEDEAGHKLEPYEDLLVDVPSELQGSVIDALNKRKALMQDMAHDDTGRARLNFIIPSRGLIGFQSEFMMQTSGQGLLYHNFSHYDRMAKGLIGKRSNGVLVASEAGKAVAYAIWNLQERGKMFVRPGDIIYEGMIVGLHSRDNDLIVNVLKAKQLNNIRAAGADENIILEPPIQLSLERAIEFIDDDELVEITPQSIRLRKRYLTGNERKRMQRK